jgi:DNA recombination protein RmuC
MGYSRSQLAENAHNIQIVAGKLVDKISTAHDHIDTLGKRILSTATAFNQLVGTVGSAITKDVNEMIELGLPNNELERPKMINPEVRSISEGTKSSDFIDVEADE